MNPLPKELLFEEVKRRIADGKSVELRVTGQSMYPCFRGDGNETIVVSPFDKLKKGMIVLFSHRGCYIFHRIIKKDGDNLVIQGDGNTGVESAKVSDVVGLVVAVVRKGKMVSVRRFRDRIYWEIWFALRPMRRYLLWGMKKLR